MFPFRQSHPADTQRAIFFVSSTGRQAQSLIVDSTRGRLFSRFYSHVPGCFSLLLNATTFLFFSLSLIHSRSLSLSVFLRYLACRQSRRNSRSKVHPRTVSREHLCLPPRALLSLRAGGPKGKNGGWKFTRHGFRSSFAPRSYGSRRSLERTVRIVISRLDISTRYSGRAEGNSSFRESIRRPDNAPLLPRCPHGTFHAGAHAPANRSHSRKVSNPRNVAMA